MLRQQVAVALAAAALVGCGGGGGGTEPAPAQPVPMTPTQALRLTAQAVMDVTELAWALSFDVQNTIVSAPTETARTTACAQGGRTIVARPSAAQLQITHESCSIGGLTLAGQVEAEAVAVTLQPDGTQWSGTVRFNAFSSTSAGRAYAVNGAATGSGFVDNVFGPGQRGQPVVMSVTGLAATRTPDALGRGATLASSQVRIERIPVDVNLARDLYALSGCLTLTANGVSAELCIDEGSRIALLENVGGEQFTGRLRWNAGTTGGFDARLRITPAGAAGSGSLRVELDLDNNGSFESAATLDRTTDIGLQL